MKHTKKFVSLLLTLVMVLAMASTTFAADATGKITIQNPVAEETYNIYLMFELESYNKETGAYAYKITNDWKEFVTTGADAHRAERVGNRLDEAIELAREAGIGYLATFEHLIPVCHRI